MDTANIKPKIHIIPDVNFAAFNQRFNRLAKRAAKLGTGEITVTEVGTEDWPVYRYGKGTRTVCFPPTKFVNSEVYEFTGWLRRYHQVVVSGSSPKLNGWEFIGSLELLFDEEGNKLGQMVRTGPDQEMPAEFRDAPVWCDHCKTNRGWHSTFVVRHEDGTYKQVGRNCLRDFTGHQSPDAIANYAEILLDLSNLVDCAEDDDWSSNGGGGERYFDIERLLVLTSAIVRKDGWASKSNSEFPTAETLTGYVLEKTDKYENRYPVEDVDRMTAEQALKWMKALTDKPRASDYEYNLSLLGRAGKVILKQFGFVASAIPAYNRAHDAEVSCKRELENSKHVGVLKDRVEMALTLIRVNYLDTSFGTMALMKFYDDNGNVIIWKTGSDPQLATKTKVRVKATISEHTEYRSCKQTEVKRLKVLETITEPATQKGAAEPTSSLVAT